MNDDFLDYDLKMRKLDSEDGFTMRGTAQVLYEADKLRSRNLSDTERSIFGEFNLVLNGTEQAEATIAEDVPDPTIYRYFVNLRTGAIQRRYPARLLAAGPRPRGRAAVLDSRQRKY